VTAADGQPIKAAKILVVDAQRGTSRAVVSDDNGNYAVANLPAGTYSVEAEAPKFNTARKSGIELEVAKDARLNFQLEPGNAVEIVAVHSSVPIVNSTNGILGGTLSNKAINDLPLNGRDFQNLVVLRPGVVRYPGGGIGSVSTNGIRPEDNNFMLDGISMNDGYYGQSVIDGTGVQGTPATILPIDAIQEFNDQYNPPAEYGWKPGNIANIGLKSGTNNLHGTGYYFGRNSALDARNYFNNDTDPKNSLRLHQFGGTLGGHIVRDKMFYFVGYEGVRDLVALTQVTTSPVTASLGGNPTLSIPDAIADLQAHGFAVNPLSAKLVGLFPSNLGTSPDGPSAIRTGFPNTNRGDNGLAKFDYHLNDRHYIAATYFIGDSFQNEQDQAVLQPQWLSQASTRAQVAGVNWTWTPLPQLFSEARFGYTRVNQLFVSADANVNATTYGINTGVTTPINFGMPKVGIAGFSSAVSGVFGGNSGWPQQLNPAATLQFGDNISYYRGKNTFKFGGEVLHISVDHLKNRLSRGKISFSGDGAFDGSSPLEDFLAGFPASGRILVGDTHRQVSFWSYAGFFSDEWHATPRVTVTAGLRYEVNTVIKEANNLLGNFDPTLGLVQVGKQVSSPYNGDHNNFAPRLGVIWDVTGQAKTILRAGGGIIYEVPPLDTFLGQFNFNNDSGTIGLNIVPTGAIGVTPGGGSISAGVQSVPGSALNWNATGPVFNVPNVDCSAKPCDVFAVNRNLRTPYVVNWNVDLQQALTKDTSIDIAYVGNRGLKLFGVTDINQVAPNSAAEVACGHCEQQGRPFYSSFPTLGFINMLGNGYRSNYNGLQATLTQRNYHGMSFLVGYTYSHALDQASDVRAPEAMNALNPNSEYGSSDFDIRHRLTAAFTYELPRIKSPGKVLEGWQLNSIITLQGGQPWNVIDAGNDTSLTGESSDRWNFFGDPSDFSASSKGPITFYPDGTKNSACVAHAAPGSPLATAGCYAQGNSVMTPPAFGTWGNMSRNMFRGPGLYSWDLSLAKKISLGERRSLQFRAEVFNILNHPNFANPYGVNNNFSQVDPSVPSTFGFASATPDVSAGNPVIGTGGPRNVQLGLKLLF
jgi:hypothetical protein